MKRLNCTYEVKKDAEFPWLLKHPKVKEGLAKFKTRQSALEWYIGLDYETAIWFQDDKKIFAGQLTIDSDPETNQWYYYIKVAGFDGEATYEGMCRELSINPQNFKIDRDLLRHRLKDIKENRDYILISDPASYFPPNLEIAKKKPKDFIDIEALKIQFEQQINILKEQLEANNRVADDDIERLKAELASKDVKYDELLNKINLLKEAYTKELQGVTYEYVHNLNQNDFIGSIALYTKKLQLLKDLVVKDKKCSIEDYNRIITNFNDYKNAVSSMSIALPEKEQRLIGKLTDELYAAMEAISSQLQINPDLEDSYANQAFYENSDGVYLPLSWDTSYVLVELKHVGFVPYDKYYYSIPYLATKATYSVTLVDSKEPTQTLTIGSVEGVVEEPAPRVSKRTTSKIETVVMDSPKTETTEKAFIFEEIMPSNPEEAVVQVATVNEKPSKKGSKKKETVVEEHVQFDKPEIADEYIVLENETPEKPMFYQETTGGHRGFRMVNYKLLQTAGTDEDFSTIAVVNDKEDYEDEEYDENANIIPVEEVTEGETYNEKYAGELVGTSKKPHGALYKFSVTMLSLAIIAAVVVTVLAMVQLIGGVPIFIAGN
ncbi:MAG3090 family protein [Mycoplasmopsis adleri]|uniref:MAG3090 family protein n=1 Tax=Mycoplasmopsis adleri TaxID=51362 RepID=UPI003872E508